MLREERKLPDSTLETVMFATNRGAIRTKGVRHEQMIATADGVRSRYMVEPAQSVACCRKKDRDPINALHIHGQKGLA